MEEQINQSVRVQTEFEEWVEGGCKKAEDLSLIHISEPTRP